MFPQEDARNRPPSKCFRRNLEEKKKSLKKLGAGGAYL
jgi:hypothetical protein